jgi:pimeloyl-ACP methyl ester carboxylesterase
MNARMEEKTMTERLRVRDEGGPGDTAVLLHGLALDLDSWHAVVPPLTAAGMRVVRFDWRAHGRSAPGGPYGLGDLAADVLAVLDDLGVDRAHLVGHSLGGSVAAEVAVAAPGRVASLAVLGGIVAGAPASPAFVGWAQEVAGLAAAGLPALRAALPHTLLYKGVPVDPALRDAAFVPENLASAYAAATAPTTTWDRLRAGAVAAPVLFLNGADDPSSPLSAEQLAALVPGARGATLAGTGHLSVVERPGPVAAALLDPVSSSR